MESSCEQTSVAGVRAVGFHAFYAQYAGKNIAQQKPVNSQPALSLRAARKSAAYPRSVPRFTPSVHLLVKDAPKSGSICPPTSSSPFQVVSRGRVHVRQRQKQNPDVNCGTATPLAPYGAASSMRQLKCISCRLVGVQAACVRM